MLGYLHIFSVGVLDTPTEKSIPRYQITFNAGETSFSRTLSEPELMEILREELALPESVSQRALREIRTEGKTTISEIDLPENEAAALGMVQHASDI